MDMGYKRNCMAEDPMLIDSVVKPMALLIRVNLLWNDEQVEKQKKMF
jgi:hypothetical protein